jgi:hypothetical protein
MTDIYLKYLQYMSPAALMHWSGFFTSLATEDELEQERDAIVTKILEDRQSYPEYFTARIKYQEVGHSSNPYCFLGIQQEYSTENYGTISQETYQSFKQTDKITAGVALRPTTGLNPYGVRGMFSNRSDQTHVGLRSGFQFENVGLIFLESEPSKRLTHTHFTEPNEDRPSPWNVNWYSTEIESGIKSGGMNFSGKIDSKLFKEGNRYDLPREILDDTMSGNISYPANWEVFFRDVSTAWLGIVENDMVGSRLDLRKELSAVDYEAILGRPETFFTTHGILFFGGIEFAKAVDAQSQTFDFYQDLDFSQVPSRTLYNRKINGEKVVVSEFNNGSGGKGIVSGEWHERMNLGLVNSHFIWQEITPDYYTTFYSPRDSQDYRERTVISPVGVPSNGILCQIVRKYPWVKVVAYPYSLQTGESFYYTEAPVYFSNTVRLNEQFSWTSMYAPDFTQVADPVYLIRVTPKYKIFERLGGTQWHTDKGPMPISITTSPGIEQPKGATRAMVFDIGWEGNILPPFEDYTSVKLSTSKSQNGPTATINQHGAIAFNFGSNAEYVVDILEVDDGEKKQRFPLYRRPAKMLASPTFQMDSLAAFDRYGACRTSAVSITGRTVSVDLPQGYKVFVSKVGRTNSAADGTFVTFDANSTTVSSEGRFEPSSSLVSKFAEECFGGIIPDRYTGTVYVQVVDTYYSEMQQITVNL